jgi:hypothetical protein
MVLAQLVGLFMNSIPAAVAQTYPYRNCHLETQFARSVKASLSFNVQAPSLKAEEWIYYAPLPPTLGNQQRLSSWTCSIDGKSFKPLEVHELSKEKRHLLLAQVPSAELSSSKKFSAKMTYQLDLYARHLAEGAVPYPYQGEALDAANYLDETNTLDFKSSTFRRWLRNNQLVRRADERDLDFAYRSFLKIRELGEYFYDAQQDRRVSKLCSSARTDCGGLAALFASTMRANKVPARLLVGRWLKPDAEPDSAKNDYGQVHVKSEFYAQNIGWVPVEMSLAVSDKTADPLKNFGRFAGIFVTFHVDPDLLIDSIYFSRSEQPWLQAPAFWVTGDGNLKDLDVEKVWQTSN